MDDHAILTELGRIGLKGVACLARMVDKERDEVLANLHEVISPNHHKKFQTIFFNEKKLYYYKLINLINILPTWQRAIDLLHLFYVKKGIDPLSQDALEFNSLVYLRYFPESKIITREN
jgi:hypothetical protein